MDALPERPTQLWKQRADLDEVVKQSLREGLSFGLIADRISGLLGFRVSREAIAGRAFRNGWHGSRKPLQQLPNNPPNKKRPVLTAPAFVKALRRAKAVVADIPATPSDSGFLGIALIDLDQNHCRYPKGDDPILFCGQAKAQGSPYCLQHAKLCYIGWK